MATAVKNDASDLPPGFTLEQPQQSSDLPEGFTLDQAPQHPEPNMGQANRTFSHVLGDAITAAKSKLPTSEEAAKGAQSALQTTKDIASVYAPIEAALNVGTGLLVGFPAYLMGGVAGLADKYALGQDVDPKELAEKMQSIFTYKPMTERGARLTGNVLMPFEKLGEASLWSGHKVTDTALKLGVPDDYAAAAGAVTDATLQMLPAALFGELGRKMAGQRVTGEDMRNVSKVIAGEDAKPAQVQATENSLRQVYEQTGIGPYTVAADAKVNPGMRADLMNEKVEIPKDYEQFLERPAPIPEPSPGDGMPLLDVESGRGEPIVAKDETKASAGETIPQPEETITAKGEIPEALPTSEQNITFTTAKGSTYQVMDDGTTVRNKSFHPEHGEQDQGMQPQSEKTFYLSKEDSEKLAEFQTQGGPEKVIAQLDDGRIGVKYLDGPDAGKFERRTVVSPESSPEKGLIPVELFDDGKRAHFGNEIVELHAGINPISAIKSLAKEYTPFVGVERTEVDNAPHIGGQAAGYNPSPLGDSLRKLFAPASRGPLAEQQAGIMRANYGMMARYQEMALEKLKATAAKFDKMPVEDNIKFIDAMERGQPLSDPKLQAAADDLRNLLDEKRTEVQELGKGQLENFDENYFPHIWKEQDAAKGLFSRRPLEGSKAFLKARTIPFTTDGMRWRTYDADGDFIKSFDTKEEALEAMPKDGRIGEPLTPITNNPVELALLKAREMDRYIYGQHIFEEMKAAGLARFVRFGAQAPDGWTKIDDKIARVLQPNEAEAGGGMILRGEYYAPDEAATLINNHLSPGLRGNAFYDAWRGVGTALNSAQLGLSLFHMGFTTMDSMISKVALGIKQIGRADFGEGLSNVTQGLNPAQPFVNLYKGDRLLRAYLGKLDSPEMAPIVSALQEAGGRVKMDDFYRNTTVNNFKQAIRTGDVVRAAKAFLPTVLDRINAPIMEQLVPRQKLGVFFDMAKDWLEENPNANVAERRAGLGKLWDSVDNRMGQLVYDNVFWNRALKDGLMASVRSVGWNLGTFRELGGGVLDAKDIARGKPMSDRTAYVIALPLVTAVYGAMLGYAYTGKMPESLKDCFFPRTGQMRPDGSEDRVSLPTYMKDVYAYGEDISNFAKYGTDPTQTLKNKANPLISSTEQMLSNKDYFGAAIRNPNDPIFRQIADEATFIAHQIEPFSIRNYQQQLQAKGETGSVQGYLTSPSMFGITPAPGYIAKSPEQQESAEISGLRDPLLKKFKQELKNGADVDETIHRMVSAGFTRRDIVFAIKSSKVQMPHRLKRFSDESGSEEAQP